MIKKAQKRVLFLVGIMLTGLLGAAVNYVRTNYSKEESSLFSTVHADIPSDGSYGCFAEGVMVSTPEGDKEIQTVKVGDIVYGFDTVTGVTGEYPVTQTFKHNKTDADYIYSPLLNITYEGGSITLTDNHWVYRKNTREGEFANFDRAGMLNVGDVLTLEDGREVAILNIEAGPEYESVYNLQVDNVHTYFADGIRVHNDGCGSGDGFGVK